jgi:hypothetical protein
MTYYIYHNLWGIKANSAFLLTTSNHGDWLLIYLFVYVLCLCVITTKDFKPLSLLSVINFCINICRRESLFILLNENSSDWLTSRSHEQLMNHGPVKKFPTIFFLQGLTTSPCPEPYDSTWRPPIWKSVTFLILKQFGPSDFLRNFFYRKLHFNVILLRMAWLSQCRPNLKLNSRIPWEASYAS